MRHGHSYRNNKKEIAVCWPEKTPYPLTPKGKKQVKKSAKKLKNLPALPAGQAGGRHGKKIDLIFTSDLLRTKQTAEIVGKEIGVKPRIDKRLRENNIGILNGKPVKEFYNYFYKNKKVSPNEFYKERYKIAPPKGETYKDIEKRMSNFIKSMEKKYKGKTILAVSHERPITLLEKVLYKYSLKKLVNIIIKDKEIQTAEVRKLKV